MKRTYIAVMATLAVVSAFVPVIAAGDSKRLERNSTVVRTRAAAERGLGFLETTAASWKRDFKCASCHHGVMTLWALCEAKSQGYAVDDSLIADTAKWSKERLGGIDNPRAAGPFSMVSAGAMYMALIARAVPSQQAITPQELKQIEMHLTRYQESDGAWLWSIAPAQNRPPPYFESDEVATLLGCTLQSLPTAAESADKVAIEQSREKAAAWLAKRSLVTSTQSDAFRLLSEVWNGKSGRALKKSIDRLKALQNKDGGWSQVPGIPSDAYATGQALYALAQADVKNDRSEIKRGLEFLIASQKEDGSWPMTSRAQPGATPFKNPVPITYLGSAWATMGLMRMVRG